MRAKAAQSIYTPFPVDTNTPSGAPVDDAVGGNWYPFIDAAFEMIAVKMDAPMRMHNVAMMLKKAAAPNVQVFLITPVISATAAARVAIKISQNAALERVPK